MAGVSPLQASPSYEFHWGSKPRYNVGESLRHGDRPLNSILAFSSGVGSEGRAETRLSLVYKYFTVIGLSKGQSRKKSASRVRRGWWEGRSWSSGSNRREIFTAVDGQSRYGKTLIDTSLEIFSRKDYARDLFVSQGYENGRGDAATESVNGEVRNFNPEEDWEGEHSDVQEEAEQRRQSIRNRQWVQLDEEKGRREAYASGTSRGAGKVTLDDDTYAWERASASGNRKGHEKVLGRTTQGGFYEEVLEEDRQSVRGPFIGLENESGSYETDRASADSIFFEQAQELGRDDGEAIAESRGPSGRNKMGYDSQLGSRSNLQGSRIYDGSLLDGTSFVLQTEREWPSQPREYLGDDNETGVRRSQLHASRDEEPRQRSIRKPAESYSSILVIDSIPQVVEAGNSSSVLREGPDYDAISSRAGTSTEGWELESVGGKWSPAGGDVDDRYIYQNSRKEDVSGTADDEELEQPLRKRENTGRNRTTIRQNQKETEQTVLSRGALYAKQVISQATAQILGVVTQLWVDMDNLSVVALEVRQNLLFGNFDSILLRSLSKVGDVILIHDENSIMDNLNMGNCSDLVGSDLFTENGFLLGKVRDYDFSLEDGAVLSLEFDTFGIPLIPSTVISTYSLTVDEVIEAQEDGLLLRNGAEKRVRKLTKGLFSQPKQPFRKWQSLPKGWRKQLPQRTSARTSSGKATEDPYMGSTINQADKRFGDAVQRDEYFPKLSPSKEQLKRTTYPLNRRGELSDSAGDNRIESDQAQDLYLDDNFASRNEYFPAEKWEDYQASPPIRKEVSRKDNPEFEAADYRQVQPQGARKFKPEVSLKSSRGLPMSYRPSPRGDNDF